MAEYFRKGCDDPNEVASDNDDAKDNDDDNDDSNSKDVEVVEIGIDEALTMLDRLVKMKYVSKEERNSHVAIKDKLENLRVRTKSKAISMIILC